MTETSSDTTRNSRTLTRSRSTAFALSALILLGLMFPLPAQAACTTPAGEAGDQFFNTTVSRMQYCDGTNWVNMGVSALSDNLGNHTASQALAMGNFKITDLATPTDATDAVTKAYVDGLVGGGDNLGDHIATTVLRSDTNNTDDLGTTAIRWKDGWFAGAVTAGSFSGVGTSLTDLNASSITSGTVPSARLGSGTANTTTYLRGDGTWAAVSGGSDGPSDCLADTDLLVVGSTCTDGSKFLGTHPTSSWQEWYVTNVNQTSSQWSTVNVVNSGSLSSDNGYANQQWIVANRTLSQYPAFQVCENLTLHGKTDWYLPARGELDFIFSNEAAIGGGLGSAHLWSSTELSSTNAVARIEDSVFTRAKSNSYSFRCVRRE